MQGEPVDWDAWKAAVREADSLVCMRQLLGQLETGVAAAWLSPLFQRDPCLVKGVWLPTGELPLALHFKPRHEARPAFDHASTWG